MMLFRDKTRLLITLMAALMILSGILLLGASVLLFTSDTNGTVRAAGSCWFTPQDDTDTLDPGVRYRVIEQRPDTLLIEDESGEVRVLVDRDQGTLSGVCGE